MPVAMIAAIAFAAVAEPTFEAAFEARYPTSTLLARMQAKTGLSCNLCHHPPTRQAAGNCYRVALTARLAEGRTIAQALADVEGLDSDGDGVDNVTEILMQRADNPTAVGYSPGLVGPTGTDPCGNAGNITNQDETPPAPECDAIDFNGDGLFPDTADIDDFLSVFSGGPCSTGTCGDIDFNNDGLFPDTLDIDSLLSVFSGGACL